MSAVGQPITGDFFNTLIQKSVAKVGVVVEDPFKDIYLNINSPSHTIKLPFSLPVGGLVAAGNTSGKGIFGKTPTANVNWNAFSVTRAPYSRPIPVERLIATSDQTGVYAELPKNIARAAQAHVPSLTTDIFVGGLTGTTISEIDNLPFFSNSHTLVGDTVIDNKLTDALSEYSYIKAAIRLNSFYVQPDAQSRPQLLNEGGKRILMVGPSQEFLAKKILKRENTPFQGNNVLYNDAEIRVNRFLTGSYANYWFLFAVGGESKAVLKWESEPIKVTFFSERNDRACAESFQWEYIVSWVGAVHPLYFHTVIGSDGTTAYTAGTGAYVPAEVLPTKAV